MFHIFEGIRNIQDGNVSFLLWDTTLQIKATFPKITKAYEAKQKERSATMRVHGVSRMFHKMSLNETKITSF